MHKLRRSYGFRFIATPEEAERLLPWFIAPPRDVAEKILHGGVPTPWIDLMPMIIFWWIFTVIYGGSDAIDCDTIQKELDRH